MASLMYKNELKIHTLFWDFREDKTFTYLEGWDVLYNIIFC